MRHLLEKTLTSRKFWAAVASAVPFAMAGDWNAFATVWMTYAGIQGAVDGAERIGVVKARELMADLPKTPPSETDTQ